jgi:anti-anti-sigma factor
MLTNTLEVVKKEEGENYEVINFWGNMDTFGLSEKRNEIMQMVDSFQKQYLVFNFAELNFLNSESIGFLMQINEKLIAANRKLVIVDAKKNVLDVLEVIGLLETLPYYKKLDDFLRSLKNDH